MSNKIIKRYAETTLQDDHELHPVLKRVYENRGVQNFSELQRDLRQLFSYQDLKDIHRAVQLLYQHLSQQHRILIVGDFDADGATSSALTVSTLKAFGAQWVEFLVPNRFEYGYGLTPEIVEVAERYQPHLIITVDNGISSIDGVAAAKAKGMDVLVTDHHLPGEQLPQADAIVNPNQPSDSFPSKHLAGVGVVFYVLCALRTFLGQQNWFQHHGISQPNMADYLDLVALGTVADVVPLDQNNRILVHQGIRRIRARHCRPGIQALLEIARRQPEQLTEQDLGFAVGPRLNAAGRLDDMSIGIACLLADHLAQARELAQELDELNQQRRTIEQDMKDQALAEIHKLQQTQLNTTQNKSLPFGLCLYDDDWHQGVIGILASRIKDRFFRPVIAFAPAEGNFLKGSARSVSGLHIRDALDAIATRYPHLIAKFGGHAMAAGLSIETQYFDRFARAFNEEVQRHIDASMLKQQIYSDGQLTHQELNLEVAQQLRDGGPWGQAFPEPVFDGRFQVISQRLVGSNHLKLTLQFATDCAVDAIAFNVDTNHWPNHRCQVIHAAYKLDVNHYQGWPSLQLQIVHMEPVRETMTESIDYGAY